MSQHDSLKDQNSNDNQVEDQELNYQDADHNPLNRNMEDQIAKNIQVEDQIVKDIHVEDQIAKDIQVEDQIAKDIHVEDTFEKYDCDIEKEKTVISEIPNLEDQYNQEDDDFDEFGDFDEGNNNDFDNFDQYTIKDFSQNLLPNSVPVPISLPHVIDIPSLSDDQIRQTVQDLLNKSLHKEEESKLQIGPMNDGPSRILATSESRAIWDTLMSIDRTQETKPIDWKRSRIRRNFYVALGVPIDLDEILPPETKAKKLILPHVYLQEGERLDSPTISSRRNSTQSVSSSRSRKEPPPPPEVDLERAQDLCDIGHERLVTDFNLKDLKELQSELEDFTTSVSDLLTYWLDMRESQVTDAELYNDMIQQLVGYAQKSRGGLGVDSDGKKLSWGGKGKNLSVSVRRSQSLRENRRPSRSGTESTSTTSTRSPAII